jgi:hypothetical protein
MWKMTWQAVSIRPYLLDFLTGKVETSANIDVTVPAFSVPEEAAGAGAKRPREEGGAGGEAGASAADAGLPKERSLHTRNSILQCNKVRRCRLNPA